jgi:hypothetical protein
MRLDPIPKDSLKTGDILLCNIPELSVHQYMDCISSVLAAYVSTGRFTLDRATPLVHWIIGYFDRCHYCHASFWNGEMVVESRAQGGLRANDISTYSEDVVDVYRYHRDDHWVGDPDLPVAPLLQEAQALVDRHWTYGFDSAYLLAILCVTRWNRSQWVDHIRDLLVRHAGPDWEAEIDALFRSYRPQIDAIVEKLIVLALEVVRKYRDRKGYVCSQAVAVIYNEAGDANSPAGTYRITKPTHLAMAKREILLAAAIPREEGGAAREEVTQRLRLQLERMPVHSAKTLSAAVHTEYESWQADLLEDTFYTPRDLAESSETELAGRLVL